MHNHCPFLSVLNETLPRSHNELVAHRANYLFCLTEINFRLVRWALAFAKPKPFLASLQFHTSHTLRVNVLPKLQEITWVTNIATNKM
jgi:hypothetical protein